MCTSHNFHFFYYTSTVALTVNHSKCMPATSLKCKMQCRHPQTHIFFTSVSHQIAQQCPEYGVMFHRVGREKRPVVGELVLGVCAKGIIVYEMKNHLRTVTRRFLWRETDSISTGVKINTYQTNNTDTVHFVMNLTVNVWWPVSVSQRRKLIIECGGPSGKKHSFITESSKIAQYLLNLCSAQHKFHSEMTSRQMNHSMIPGGILHWLCGLCCFQFFKERSSCWHTRVIAYDDT